MQVLEGGSGLPCGFSAIHPSPVDRYDTISSGAWYLVYPDLEQVLVPFVGRPYREKRVQGVGGPGITEIAGPLATVVVKHSLTPAEQHFYQRYRSQVVRYGVDAPRLLASGHFADDAWVVLEFVPPLLDKFRWSERPDVLTIL
ncbi:MAG: hypothetical protein ACYCOU_05105, partial [Sulfobacillus sp.]